ncbi:MAG: transglutaminase domain-containing protein [Isosphaeraceae bacterium]|nr:transglutaminase domain-containing protein [Isosphaeraceae bacterium]
MTAFAIMISSLVAVAAEAGTNLTPLAELSLLRAPERRADWEAILDTTKKELRPGLVYLIEHLPLIDLRSLPPQELLENTRLAYEARAATPWGMSVPEEIFLDAVLPHVSVTEPRRSSREAFMKQYLDLVKDAEGPGVAAARINQRLFQDHHVVYNTRRLRTDQCSKESIAQGMATCTGLSIMLVEACRSVGIPARLAGIPSWPGRGGNHTWVEIWDSGRWHFVGAAEPDEKGLDHAWFAAEVRGAVRDVPRNAVWAATYRRTGLRFPMVWSPRGDVPGENVTDRYTGGVTNAPRAPRLMVEVRKAGERVVADVEAFDTETGERRLEGKSVGPRGDVNLHLSTVAASGDGFLVVARAEGRASCRIVSVEKDTVVRIDIDEPDSESNRAGLRRLFDARFGSDVERREAAAKLLAAIPVDESSRAIAWEAYRRSPMHEQLRAEFEAKEVVTGDRRSPYLFREVGEKPKGLRPLVIAMHGGGGTAKRINDSQWKGMFERYYKDHPEVGGYVYLALRAPNDEWNGFYDDAICPLVERLIRQFVLFADVDPDRVVILGASHGGYGAFVIGPKMPDRFSAIHASASAPTDGETRGENLRNVHFTWMVGSKDTAYGRADRCKAFEEFFLARRKEFGGFPGGLEWKEGVGHSVPDRDHLAHLLRLPPRTVRPDRLIWTQSDAVIRRFYWIEDPAPAEGRRIEARVEGNTVRIETDAKGPLTLHLDTPFVDPSAPIRVERRGSAPTSMKAVSNLEVYAADLERTGDPRAAAGARIDLPAREDQPAK